MADAQPGGNQGFFQQGIWLTLHGVRPGLVRSGGIAFDHAGLDGGFFRSEQIARASAGGALIVLYSEDLPRSQAEVEAAGGTIVRPVFAFPGATLLSREVTNLPSGQISRPDHSSAACNE